MKTFICAISFLLLASTGWGQAAPPSPEDKSGIFAVVKDVQGDTVEGFLRLHNDEITVQSQDNQEKSVAAKYIKSITLEKIRGELPIDEQKKAGYKVQLENCQEIYTLKNKFSFSLNTNLGVVTKTIDPDRLNSLLSRESAPGIKGEDLKSFIQDKSIVFSLEFKF